MPKHFQLVIRRLLIGIIVWGLFIIGGHLPAAHSQAIEEVRVMSAPSGQSLEVTGPTSPLAEPVRLLGIDAPDPRQEPWGPEATRHLNQWLQGQTVRLELAAGPEDAYGRKLAFVWLGDTLVNERLVAEGWAMAQASMAFTAADRPTRYDDRLLAAQEKARLLGRGIWHPQTPLRQTPAVFRQQEAL